MRFQGALSAAVLFGISKGHTIFVQLEVEGTTYREEFSLHDTHPLISFQAVSHAIRDPSYDGVSGSRTFSQLSINDHLAHQRRDYKLCCMQRRPKSYDQ